MFLTSILLAALSVHFSIVQAYEFATAKLCTTNYGAKSTAVKTNSYVVTVPITILKKFTTTLTSTITPAPATTTSTETVTTTSVVLTTPTETFTDTVSTTSTLTTTQIFFEEATTTTSTTTSVATSTVPTAAGFTPLASASGYVAKRSSEDAAAPAIRGRRMEERAAPRKLSCPQVGKPGSFGQFPQSVICGALVIAKTTSTRTFTATNKATTTLPVATSTITVSSLYPHLPQKGYIPLWTNHQN
ncbi:hypothetical protein XANCAGTX0491_009982 [Xanthoria calcicola]